MGALPISRAAVVSSLFLKTILRTNRKRLAEFILANVEAILTEWELFARSLEPGRNMTKLALRDNARAILLATVRDMQLDQSPAEQASKSQGHGGAVTAVSDRLDAASALHGVERVGAGFNIKEVASEYRALRASVLRWWRLSLPKSHLEDIDDIIRFNESIDQSLAEAVDSYTKRLDESRRMFLAILSHDLRNPLTCIRIASRLVARNVSTPDDAKAASMIETNMDATLRLVGDLIEFASTGLGEGMELKREPVNLEALCHEVVDGYQYEHPGRTLRYYYEGNLTGQWDSGRLRQVISNLIGNAIDHGARNHPVNISIASEESMVVLSVHNNGVPIPQEMLPVIFDPLVRIGTPESAPRRPPGSIGLGLYIVKKIVIAHGGTIEVNSTAHEGTTFTVRLPRTHPPDDAKHSDVKTAE